MNHKKKTILASGILIITALFFLKAFDMIAAPSISNIHVDADASIDPESTDGTNTAAILSEDDIYVGRSNKNEYMIKDEKGHYQPTPLSNAIETAEETITETKENGKSLVQKIPEVTEIVSRIDKDAVENVKKDYELDLTQTMQLTYMMDLKYRSTDTRVIAGEKREVGMKTVILDNGMIEAEIDGGEIMRQDDPQTIHIFHVDAKTRKISILSIEDYDEKTGLYTTIFPSIGPYMLIQDVKDTEETPHM